MTFIYVDHFCHFVCPRIATNASLHRGIRDRRQLTPFVRDFKELYVKPLSEVKYDAQVNSIHADCFYH